MPQVFLAIGILAVSTAPLFIRLAQPTSPILIAAARVLIAGVVLGLFAGRSWSRILQLPIKKFALCILSGLALALHFGLWIWSLSLTSTTASVALVATQPIFAGLLGYLLLDEGFRRQESYGMAVAVIGTLVLAGADLGGTSSDALIGDALALGGAIAVPAYLLVGRALRDDVPLLAYLSLVNLVAGAALLIVGGGIGVSFEGIGQEEYLAMIALGLVCSVLGHTMLNHCVRLVPVHLVSLGILVEPVLASLSTWAVFGEVPTVPAAVGGLIIIFGIYVGFGWRRAEAN
jgi:drug/metabolite transporter (DMT)-like permease